MKKFLGFMWSAYLLVTSLKTKFSCHGIKKCEPYDCEDGRRQKTEQTVKLPQVLHLAMFQMHRVLMQFISRLLLTTSLGGVILQGQ